MRTRKHLPTPAVVYLQSNDVNHISPVLRKQVVVDAIAIGTEDRGHIHLLTIFIRYKQIVKYQSARVEKGCQVPAWRIDYEGIPLPAVLPQRARIRKGSHQLQQLSFTQTCIRPQRHTWQRQQAQLQGILGSAYSIPPGYRHRILAGLTDRDAGGTVTRAPLIGGRGGRCIQHQLCARTDCSIRPEIKKNRITGHAYGHFVKKRPVAGIGDAYPVGGGSSRRCYRIGNGGIAESRSGRPLVAYAARGAELDLATGTHDLIFQLIEEGRVAETNPVVVVCTACSCRKSPEDKRITAKNIVDNIP